MSIGIRPVNDLAFKKTFGTVENKLALINLLNTILDLHPAIVDMHFGAESAAMPDTDLSI